MFQKSIKAVTGNKLGKGKKRIMYPKFQVNTMADVYSLYVFVCGVSEDLFWDADIRFLELVYINKMAWDTYKKNPKEM